MVSLVPHVYMYMCFLFLHNAFAFVQGWTINENEESLVVSLLDINRSIPDVHHSVVIKTDLSWKIYVYGKEVPVSKCRLLLGGPATMSTVSALSAVVLSLDTSNVCIGNDNEKFQELQRSWNGIFPDKHCEYILYTFKLYYMYKYIIL